MFDAEGEEDFVESFDDDDFEPQDEMEEEFGAGVINFGPNAEFVLIVVDVLWACEPDVPMSLRFPGFEDACVVEVSLDTFHSEAVAEVRFFSRDEMTFTEIFGEFFREFRQ